MYNNKLGVRTGTRRPKIISSDNGVIIRHREYMGDIAPTEEFTVLAYQINPGNSACFPWLSTIATSFEQYKIRGLVFEFLSTSSDAVLSDGANTSLGTVIMGTEYNSLATGFTTKSQMLNHENSVQVKPSNSMLHMIECNKNQSPLTNLYIRDVNDVSQANADPRLYDLGIFQIATQGMQGSTGNIGGLWCSYEIELFKPQIPYNPPTNTAAWVTTGATTAADPFGPMTTPSQPGSQLLGECSNGHTFEFNDAYDEGYYLFVYEAIGTVAGQVDDGISAAFNLTNCTLMIINPSPLGNGHNPIQQAPDISTSTSTRFMASWIIRINQSTEGNPAAFDFILEGSLPSGTKITQLFVTRISREAGEKMYTFPGA